MTGFFAQLVKCTGTECGASELQQLVVDVINFMLGISVLLSILFILYGGFLLLTSGGSIGTAQSPGRIARGKKAITGAITGLVITFIAFIVVNTVIRVLTGCRQWEWWLFQDFPC